MSRKSSYSSEFKAKIVLEILQGEKELAVVAKENNINPNLIRNRKKTFLENANKAFDSSISDKEDRRKEVCLEKERDDMLKTIGQLTLERNFLQDCFHKVGKPIPKFDKRK